MLCSATGAGVEKVMVPTKYAKMARLTPLARSVVGKISAAQTNEGASMHFPRIQFRSTCKRARHGLPGKRR